MGPETRFRLTLTALALAGACKPDTTLPQLFAAEPATAVDIWVGDGSGVQSASLSAFAVNDWGAPVLGDAISLTSTASLTTLPVDAAGWVAATVTAEVGAWPVTAAMGASQANGAAYITEVDVPSVEFPAIATDATTSAILAAGGGVVWSAYNELWWAPLGTGAPIRVASLPDDVRGMDGCQGDGDGITDLLVWTDTSVALLRGRAGGGLHWGGGWSAPSGKVAGATAVDLDGDTHMDLAILLVEDGQSQVPIFHGDGNWGFTYDDLLAVDFTGWSIGAEDLDEDGAREITVLSSDALLRRYARQEESWTVSGTYDFPVYLLEGARIYPSADLTADGIADLIVVGPDETGDGAQAWVIEAAEASVAYKMFSPGATATLPATLSAAVGELSGDSVTDLVLVSDTQVFTAFWNVDGESFTLYSYDALPADAPVSVAELTGDGIGDILVGGDQATILPGQRVDDDPATPGDESIDWRIQTPSAKVTDFNLSLPPEVFDIDGDALVDLVMVATTATGLQLQIYGGEAADTDSAEGFRSRGSVVLSTTGTARDLAVCDQEVYATIDDGVGGVELHHYRISSSGAPAQVGASVAVAGTHIACGPVIGGDVAVVADDGTVYLVNGTTVTAGESTGSAVSAAAGADTDGDGRREIVTCAAVGCSVTVGDYDGDGVEDVAVAEYGAIDVMVGGAPYTVYGEGVVSSADADGDGQADVLVADRGEIRVYRAVPGGLVPGRASFVWRPAGGPAGAGDLDGDGIPDLFLTGADSDSADAIDWSGTLIYARGTSPG